MSIFTKPIVSITYEDVFAFCVQGIKENVNLDYKQDFPNDLAKVISALANTYGGIVIIGVADEDGKPKAPFVGIDFVEGMEERVTSICVDGISPPFVPEIQVCRNENLKAFVVIRVVQSDQTPHAVQNNTRIYIRTGNISKPEDPMNYEKVEWLTNRRKKAEDFRELLYSTTDEHCRKALLASKATIELGECSISFCPLFPSLSLTNLNELEDFVRSMRICLSDSSEFPNLHGGVELLKDGLCSLMHNEGVGYVNYFEVNRFGLVHNKQSLCYRRRSNGEKTIYLSAILTLLTMSFESVARLYSKLGYWGLVHTRVSLKKVIGADFIPLLDKNSNWHSSRSTDKMLDDHLSWNFTWSFPELRDDATRTKRIVTLIQEIAWSFGHRVSEKLIIEWLRTP